MKNKQSISFVKHIRYITFLMASIGFILASIPAHASDPVYVVVEYIKVKPEDHMKYLEMEQKIWKPMHQERINEGIPAFEAALKKEGTEYQLYMYPGAKHAFNNDTNPDRYDREAAQLMGINVNWIK